MWMWILICLNFISKVHGYPSAPFPESCESMLTQHTDRRGQLVRPQTSEPPFEVDYKHGNKGEPITVFLRDKHNTRFRGFMLQARERGMVNEGRPVGKFILLDPSMTKLQTCNGLQDSAVGQKDNIRKSLVQVNWTAEGAELDITFRATFVKDYWKFWEPFDVDVILPTQPSTTTSTTQPSTTTSTTEPSTTTSTAEPSTTTSTTKPSATSNTQPSTTTSNTQPSTTTSTTKPSATSNTQPSTTTSTAEPSTTASTTKPSTTTSNTQPSTTTSTTKPSATATTTQLSTSTTQPSTTTSNTQPSTTTSTTKPSATSNTQPSTTTSTTQPSTTASTTKPSSTRRMQAVTILTSVCSSIKLVEMELLNIVTILSSSLSLNEGLKISCIVLCAALDILAVILLYIGHSFEATLVALVFVEIVFDFIELVIVSLPLGPSHELKDICDLAIKVCALIRQIFATAIIFVGVLKLDVRRESWLVKVMVTYAVWIFLFAVWFFVVNTHGRTILGSSKRNVKKRQQRQKKTLRAAEVTVIAVSVIIIAGSISFSLAIIVGIFGCQEK
ncbi:uncharacterized protein [Trachinotus anak]|uniref:uncharacterized protein n=1 Tax=Trachinotus anak TaxID=443729 RepID=UPI0039F1A83D